MAVSAPFASWKTAYGTAVLRAHNSGYRYRVRADRARPGLWLISRGARRIRVQGER